MPSPKIELIESKFNDWLAKAMRKFELQKPQLLAAREFLKTRRAIRLSVPGVGDRWLVFSFDELQISATPPADASTLATVSVDATSLDTVLWLLEEFEDTELPSIDWSIIGRLADPKLQQSLGSNRLAFDLIITDFPSELPDLRLRCGIGFEDVPSIASFGAVLSFDDIEDLLAGELSPHQLIARSRLTGDSSKAVALGMFLLNPQSKP
ncbi:MAG: hypothetical protein NZM37_11670 [Sandaracinaceae bacterium]|nr:hypothetical protein [Sandaracinaceae bacterium]MDW8246912.1 hypothetical protein [Sandaracinaceae bacterium]